LKTPSCCKEITARLLQDPEKNLESSLICGDSDAYPAAGRKDGGRLSLDYPAILHVDFCGRRYCPTGCVGPTASIKFLL